METHFSFYSNLTIQENVTKRQLLSETAKFDPVGWLSPIVIRFKVLLQKLWVQGIEWDQLVSKELQNEWEQIKDDLPNLAELKLQRCISPPRKIANVQLHLFTDASEMAYAAVIYARIWRRAYCLETRHKQDTGCTHQNSLFASIGTLCCPSWNQATCQNQGNLCQNQGNSQIYQAQLSMDGLIPR